MVSDALPRFDHGVLLGAVLSVSRLCHFWTKLFHSLRVVGCKMFTVLVESASSVL